MIERLELRKAVFNDKWYIVDREDELDDHGPYDTREDAEEGQRGLICFLKAKP